MRLDTYLVQNKYFESRTKANQAIERGEVFISSKAVFKASYDVKPCDIVTVCMLDSFVSLGGYKLDKALNDFNFKVNDLIVADVGASTGGFTDCVLKRGAKKVYAVDLNSELLHQSLKNDDRVVEIIKNVKDLTKNDFDSKIDLIVADLSFISSSIYLPILSDIIDNDKYLILLIKPQFENGEKKRFKNGIIRDEKIHKSVVDSVIYNAKLNLFTPVRITKAPEKEDKNLEFLILLRKGEDVSSKEFDLDLKNLFVK